MSLSRLTFAATLLLGAAAGCGRAEPDPKTQPTGAPTTAQTAANTQPVTSVATSAPSTGQPRCVAPWAQQAATQQLPASSCPAEPEGAPPLAVATVRFLDAPGRPGVRVEVARSNAQRARGLMYRTSLSEDEGMIFVWSEEAPRSFWMHNTCVALDMLFVDREGYIAGILEQVPTLNDLPRAVPCPAQFVIETKAGFCRRHGVSPGQRVAIDG
jgi:uncharacterized membrane protein (UPF0127 family)